MFPLVNMRHIQDINNDNAKEYYTEFIGSLANSVFAGLFCIV